jgi:hypothetical protein
MCSLTHTGLTCCLSKQSVVILLEPAHIHVTSIATVYALKAHACRSKLSLLCSATYYAIKQHLWVLYNNRVLNRFLSLSEERVLVSRSRDSCVQAFAQCFIYVFSSARLVTVTVTITCTVTVTVTVTITVTVTDNLFNYTRVTEKPRPSPFLLGLFECLNNVL